MKESPAFILVLIGFFTGILFIILKLFGLNWSWWIVLSPFWIPTLILFLILGAAGVFVYFENRKQKKFYKKFHQDLMNKI